MKEKMLTIAVDCSESMYSRRNEVMSRYNSFINRAKMRKPNTLITLILFNSTTRVMECCTRVDEVKEMTRWEYYVKGETALLDALSTTLDYTEELNESLTAADRKIIVIFVSDGLENSSKSCNHEQIKDRIKEKEKQNWKIRFVGFDFEKIDAEN